MDSELGVKVARGRQPHARDGFTLVEILIVLALIALFSAGIGLALGEPSPVARLRQCEVIMADLVRQARFEAVRWREETRVIVLMDPDYPKRNLRSAAVVHAVSGMPGQWRTVGEPVPFPEGIYFWPERSITDGRFRLPLPERETLSAGTGPFWHYYAFSPRGQLADGAMRSFVIGAVAPGRPAFDVEGTPSGGLAIYPLGTLTFAVDGEDLE